MLDRPELQAKSEVLSTTGENPKDLEGAKKVDISLFPAVGQIHGAHAMMNGAARYGPYNWREKKVRARVYIAAAQRHLAAFLDGEEIATDSGVHHLGHAIACMAILLDAQETGNLVDDRPLPGAAASVLKRLEIKNDWLDDWRRDQEALSRAKPSSCSPPTA